MVQLNIVQDGREVLRASRYPVDQPPASQGRDLQVLRSISKAVLAILAAMAAEAGALDLDEPVHQIWPEFAAAGKDAVTGRHLLTHRAGLPVFDQPVRAADVLSWEPAVELLAAQRPRWTPGTAHGYHDLTYGWLVGEWLRRRCGASVGQLVEMYSIGWVLSYIFTGRESLASSGDEVTRIVQKCAAHDTSERYKTVLERAADVERLDATPTSGQA